MNFSNSWIRRWRFDLQTRNLAGTNLRAVRDREKQGDARGSSFLNGLNNGKSAKSGLFDDSAS